MNPAQPKSKNSQTKNILVVTGVIVLLLTWITADCFYTAHCQLSSLVRVAGPLRTAVVRRTTGKNPHNYLTFSLVNHSQKFSINEYGSPSSLTDIQQIMLRQQQAQPGTDIIVYYNSPSWWDDAINVEAYQIELPYEVIYPIDEVHRRALSQAALAMLLLFIISMVGLGQYLSHRVSPEVDT